MLQEECQGKARLSLRRLSPGSSSGGLVLFAYSVPRCFGLTCLSFGPPKGIPGEGSSAFACVVCLIVLQGQCQEKASESVFVQSVSWFFERGVFSWHPSQSTRGQTTYNR